MTKRDSGRKRQAWEPAGPGFVAVLLTGLLISAAPRAQRPSNPRPGSAPSFDVYEKSIAELQDAMRAGRVTSKDLVESYLARIRAYEQAGPAINAFIALNPRAAEDAAALDAERRTRGARGPLHGIPIAIKDNYAT